MLACSEACPPDGVTHHSPATRTPSPGPALTSATPRRRQRHPCWQTRSTTSSASTPTKTATPLPWSARLVRSSRTRASPPTPPATAAATGSQSSRRQDVGSGRSRAPAATAPASPPTCSSRANGSSRSTVLPARRAATAKTDDLDAVRAAREALGRDHLAQPRRRGDREAIRVLLTTRHGAVVARTKAVCHLKALLVSAPEGLRMHFRKMTTDDQVIRCARLRTSPHQSAEHRCTIVALRSTARRTLALEAEADDLETEIERLVKAVAPRLLEEPGVGGISAAQILCSWSHRGRLRSEAAFAALGGVAPIPASSGQTVRFRLNRGGDRQLNRALHTIVLSRLVHHPETRAYASRRAAEGRSPREIKRCLKRHLSRRLFKLLEASVLGA